MVLVGLVQRETKVVVEDQTPLHAVVARKVAATSTNTEMLNELCRNQRNLIMTMRNKFTCSQLQVHV